MLKGKLKTAPPTRASGDAFGLKCTEKDDGHRCDISVPSPRSVRLNGLDRGLAPHRRLTVSS